MISRFSSVPERQGYAGQYNGQQPEAREAETFAHDEADQQRGSDGARVPRHIEQPGGDADDGLRRMTEQGGLLKRFERFQRICGMISLTERMIAR